MTKTVHIVHGFNVSDGGKDTVAKLKPYFECRDYPTIVHDYGWVGPFLLRLRNKQTVDELKHHIKPGDAFVGHSNGCLIGWRLLQAGAPLSSVICIQPALRKDTKWSVPTLCLYNNSDWAVRFGRIWGRLASAVTCSFHGWGAAGAYGFDTTAENWNTKEMAPEAFRVGGHSNVFKDEYVSYWGERVADWWETPENRAHHLI